MRLSAPITHLHIHSSNLVATFVFQQVCGCGVHLLLREWKIYKVRGWRAESRRMGKLWGKKERGSQMAIEESGGGGGFKEDGTVVGSVGEW